MGVVKEYEWVLLRNMSGWLASVRWHLVSSCIERDVEVMESLTGHIPGS